MYHPICSLFLSPSPLHLCKRNCPGRINRRRRCPDMGRRRRRRVGEAGPRPRPLVRPPSSLTSASGSARLLLSSLLSPLSLYCMNNGDTFIKPRCCYEIKAPFDAPRAESVGLRASRFPLNPPLARRLTFHMTLPRENPARLELTSRDSLSVNFLLLYY